MSDIANLLIICLLNNACVDARCNAAVSLQIRSAHYWPATAFLGGSAGTRGAFARENPQSFWWQCCRVNTACVFTQKLDCINGPVRAEMHSAMHMRTTSWFHPGVQGGTKGGLALSTHQRLKTIPVFPGESGCEGFRFYRRISTVRTVWSSPPYLNSHPQTWLHWTWYVNWTRKLRQTFFTVTPNLTQKYDQTSNHQRIK